MFTLCVNVVEKPKFIPETHEHDTLSTLKVEANV